MPRPACSPSCRTRVRAAGCALAVASSLARPSAADVGASPEVPAALRCLERHYGVVAERSAGGWEAGLPDGRRLRYDDGRAKSEAERLADPDLEDTFAIPYQPGPIQAITRIDEDPGRARVEALFEAVYGVPPRGVDAPMVSFLGQRVRIHRKISAALARVAERLERAVARDGSMAPFLSPLGGGLANRSIAGTSRRSAHAFGIALDLNPRLSDYWRWQRGAGPRWRNRVPQAIVDAFEAEGFIWGGRWYHHDTMHFEYRPELLDPACREAAKDSSGAVPAAADSPRR